MNADVITMSHGGGGRESAKLIREIFVKNFGNDASKDAAVLTASGKIAFTTDSFVVNPPFFPGGDIGRLAVCGTVNDLLTSGAKPLYLSAGFIIEEGFPLADSERICESMRETAIEAGVRIVTGDTKVVEPHGEPGIYINTSGIGEVERELSFSRVREGDALIVTGNLGDHHACIISRRLDINSGVPSDAAPLCDIMSDVPDAHAARDITRGGLATILHELRAATGLRSVIYEDKLPVGAGTRAVCAMLGLDPLHMGCEGRMLIIGPEEIAGRVRKRRYGENAAVVGFVERGEHNVMRTKIGGSRVIRELAGEGLPRIC